MSWKRSYGRPCFVERFQLLLPRRCLGSLCVWSAHMSSMIVVGCHVPHWRDAPRNLEVMREAALPQDSQTGTPHDCLEEAWCVNWVSEPCGRIGIEGPDPLVRTCLSDVAHFSVRLLQHLCVRCDVRKRCAGALSCAVLLRALSDCARTRHV